jgi:hypothetical protein
MKKSLLILVLTALVACGSTEPAPDRFASIAEEWQGGNVQDMINVWGDPKSLEQAGADGYDGVAVWQYIYGGSSVGTGGGSHRSRCEATAYFNANGFISNIEVISQRCNGIVRSHAMEELRRP